MSLLPYIGGAFKMEDAPLGQFQTSVVKVQFCTCIREAKNHGLTVGLIT